MHNGGCRVSQVANELSATERADHTLPKNLAILAECLSNARLQHSLTRSTSALPKFSGTYFLPMGRQACGLFAAVHTSSSGPPLWLIPQLNI